MGQFMEQDGCEEADHGAGAHDPMRPGGEIGVGRREDAHRQGPGHEHGENQPARIDVDREAHQPEQFDAPSEHDSSLRRRMRGRETTISGDNKYHT
jgi:hypothetical protein